MKKIFLSALILFGLLSFQSNVQASPYPNHLNGDPDYVLTDGHMGTAWYMKKSSLNVELYDPPIYIISVSLYTINNADRGNTTYRDIITCRFRYDWNNRAMYVETGYNEWYYLNPHGSWAETGIRMPTGEMAFYMTYGKRFYGTNGYFDDDFYSRAD